MSAATYLYCVIAAGRRPAMGRPPNGVPGATRAAVLPGGTAQWLVVAEVPLDVYGSEVLQSRLEDMRWVGDVAVGHESMIEHFMKRRGTTVIPMTLFTMFSSPERAVAEIRARRKEIAGIARRIGGSEEWGVRVSRSAAGRRATGRSGAAASQGQRTGSGFLAAKKRARDEAREAAEAAVIAAESAFATLAPASRETRRRTDVPDGALAPPLLDAAFLVATARRARFRALASKAAVACAAAGADLTVTGPWPAYNFVGPGD